VLDPASPPLAAQLGYREPREIGDEVELVRASAGTALMMGLRAAGRLKAVARVEAR